MATYTGRVVDQFNYQQIPWITWTQLTKYIDTTTAGAQWLNWNSTGTSLNSYQIWDNWQTTTTGTVGDATWQNWLNQGYNYSHPVPPVTDEELAAGEARIRALRAEADERIARERADAAEAEQRAEDLLCSQLRPGQRRMLRERRKFYIRSQHGRRYEIARGHHQNVYEVDSKGQRLKGFCIYAAGGVPPADSMLAQKLHLEFNEDHFLKVAHETVVPRAA